MQVYGQQLLPPKLFGFWFTALPTVPPGPPGSYTVVPQMPVGGGGGGGGGCGNPHRMVALQPEFTMLTTEVHRTVRQPPVASAPVKVPGDAAPVKVPRSGDAMVGPWNTERKSKLASTLNELKVKVITSPTVDGQKVYVLSSLLVYCAAAPPLS